MAQYILMEPMLVTEKVEYSKYGCIRRSEDLIFLSDDFIAVIDSTSGPCEKLFKGETIGQRLCSKANEYLRALDPCINANDFIDGLTEYIRISKLDLGIRDMRTSGGFVFCIFSRHWHEIRQLGDCRAMTNERSFNQAYDVENVSSRFRSAYLEALILGGLEVEKALSNDPSLPIIAKYLEAQQAFANTNHKYGYGVLNGDPVLLSSYVVHPLKDTEREIVLASDGYPKIFSSLEKTEEYLSNILKNDPLCIRNFLSPKGCYAGQVSYDDRSFVKFIV